MHFYDTAVRLSAEPPANVGRVVPHAVFVHDSNATYIHYIYAAHSDVPA